MKKKEDDLEEGGGGRRGENEKELHVKQEVVWGVGAGDADL